MSTNKIFAIAELVGKLDKIATENRYDQVSQIMREVYEKKMEKNPNLTVSSDEIRKTWSTVYNLNPNSNFTDKLDEVFEKQDESQSFSEGSPFRIAGFEEDFRPTPIDVKKSEEEIIKDSSFGLLKKVAAGHVVNPQYHFGQFVNVPQAGEGAGVALWTIAFNTKRGLANISVPINVVAGRIYPPEVFYATGHIKGIPFNSENLKAFASEYNPGGGQAKTELSDFGHLGTNSYISERQDIKEAQVNNEGSQAHTISVSYSVPLDESLVANVDKAEAGVQRAISEARSFVEQKIRTANPKGSMNINLQINYSGALGLDGEQLQPSVEQPVEGVFAFNASQKTRNGLKTITIPVVLANNKYAADVFHTESGPQELNASNVMNYFSAENQEPKSEDAPSDAFSEAFMAFLKSDATYGQILDEIKATIKSNEYKKAASYLMIINERFGDNAFKHASENYVEFVKQAAEENRQLSTSSFFHQNVNLV